MKEGDLERVIDPKLWEMAQRDSRLQIVKPGGAASVLDDMRQRKTNAAAQVDGCWKLAKFALKYEDKVLICNNNGVPVILQGMKSHAWNLQLQQIGCALLRLLTTIEKGRQLVAQGGGREVAVGAMRQHEDDVVVQQNGCMLLAALQSEGKEQVSNPNGVEAVTDAMRRHRDDLSIQCRGLQALQLMAENADNRSHMVYWGTNKVVGAAIKRHGAVPEVREVAGPLHKRLEEWRREHPGFFSYLCAFAIFILLYLSLFILMLCFLHEHTGPVASLITSAVISATMVVALRQADLL